MPVRVRSGKSNQKRTSAPPRKHPSALAAPPVLLPRAPAPPSKTRGAKLVLSVAVAAVAVGAVGAAVYFVWVRRRPGPDAISSAGSGSGSGAGAGVGGAHTPPPAADSGGGSGQAEGAGVPWWPFVLLGVLVVLVVLLRRAERLGDEAFEARLKTQGEIEEARRVKLSAANWHFRAFGYHEEFSDVYEGFAGRGGIASFPLHRLMRVLITASDNRGIKEGIEELVQRLGVVGAIEFVRVCAVHTKDKGKELREVMKTVAGKGYYDIINKPARDLLPFITKSIEEGRAGWLMDGLMYGRLDMDEHELNGEIGRRFKLALEAMQVLRSMYRRDSSLGNSDALAQARRDYERSKYSRK